MTCCHFACSAKKVAPVRPSVLSRSDALEHPLGPVPLGVELDCLGGLHVPVPFTLHPHYRNSYAELWSDKPRDRDITDDLDKQRWRLAAAGEQCRHPRVSRHLRRAPVRSCLAFGRTGFLDLYVSSSLRSGQGGSPSCGGSAVATRMSLPSTGTIIHSHEGAGLDL